MGFLSSFFKKSSTDADFNAAKQEREKFLSTVSTDSESDAVNAAAALMLDRNYTECIAAYEAVAAKDPEQRGNADSQINQPAC